MPGHFIEADAVMDEEPLRQFSVLFRGLEQTSIVMAEFHDGNIGIQFVTEQEGKEDHITSVILTPTTFELLGLAICKVSQGDWGAPIHGAASALSAGLEGAYGGKALEILMAIAQLAADGKSLTIDEDWGFGSATVIDEDGAHTHVGCDHHEDWRANFEAFVSQLHSLLVGKRGKMICGLKTSRR